MRILYVFPSLAVWGGIERILTDKMNCLTAMYGWEVAVVTTDQGRHPLPYTLAEGVVHADLGIGFHHQYACGGWRRWLTGWRMQRLFEARLSEQIDRLRPDVIACTTNSFVGTLARLKGDTPMVVECHSVRLHSFPRASLRQTVRSLLLKRALRKAQAIVTLTERDAAEWRKDYARVVSIPNMVQLGSQSGRCCDYSARRVVFVGRFDYQKRVLTAMRVWQKVWPDFPDWSLEVYGEGEQQQEAEAMAATLQMNIHLHRPTAAIMDAYCGASLLVSTSLFEPFGLVIAEAMGCGLPVVAFDCPYGPASIVTDGDDGYLVQQDDEAALARCMRQLMGDEELRRSMGQRAVAAAQRYSAARVMPQWKALFEELGKKPTPASPPPAPPKGRGEEKIEIKTHHRKDDTTLFINHHI